MKSHLLKGEFDLHITDYCNLHCDGCIVLDYQQSGQVTNEKLSLKDVKDIIWELEKRKLRLEQLKILGGEPTLHNELHSIIDYIKSSNITDKLTLVTNGLNLTGKIIESLSKLDSLLISVYPMPDVLSIEKVFNDSQVRLKLISDGVDVNFFYQDEFELYGVEQQGVEYNSELNWKRCFQKDSCRVINLDGIYRCTVTYSEKKNLCGWNQRKDIIDFIESDVPLSHCKVCPTPPARMKWDSTKLKTDLKNYTRGINLIQDWSHNDK